MLSNIKFTGILKVVTEGKGVLQMRRLEIGNELEKNNKCIGLPVKGRAQMNQKKKSYSRDRIDVISGKKITYRTFKRDNAALSPDEFKRRWKSLPRVQRIKRRFYNDEELSWEECTIRYGDYFGRGELYTWYVNLPWRAA